jgi:threonine/homoserine/homoserine lactone efflux protein
MPDSSTLALYAGAVLVLLVIPGPAVLYIVSQSVEHGRRAGVTAVAGIHVGTLVHTTAAAVGLSALLVSSATAFSVVKFAGAAYLLYLGIQRLLSREEEQPQAVPRERDLGRIFRQGIVVNVLNPKTALFFFAFVPQFVDRGVGSVPLQVLVFGLAFVLIGFLSDGAWAIAAGTAGGWLRRSRRFQSAQRWVTGAILIGLGVVAALTGRKASTA